MLSHGRMRIVETAGVTGKRHGGAPLSSHVFVDAEARLLS
jgi:hypothetical protein